MSSSEADRTGRRGFFLSLAAGLGEAMAEAAEQFVPEETTAAPTAEEPEARVPTLQRRSVPPSAIPDVRR